MQHRRRLAEGSVLWRGRQTGFTARFPGTIVLVGAGKMGGAMLEGWLARKLDPEEGRGARAAAVEGDQGAGPARRADQSRSATSATAAAMVIAVKPQARPTRCPLLRRSPARRPSWSRSWPAARWLSRKARRRRPRSSAPCRTRRPRSDAASPSPSATRRDTRGRETRACAAGRHRRGRMGRRRKLMDAVTAVSGSGPAYVFLLAESLARAGVAAGLPADSPTRWRGRPSRVRANSCTAGRRSMPRRCART